MRGQERWALGPKAFSPVASPSHAAVLLSLSGVWSPRDGGTRQGGGLEDREGGFC